MIDFSHNSSQLLAYLISINFFRFLPSSVEITPESITEIRTNLLQYRKHYSVIEEITCGKELTEDLNGLTSPIEQQLSIVNKENYRSKVYDLKTIISELIGNIHEHSNSKLSGYAATQLYQEKIAIVTICDSGEGLLKTIKQTIQKSYSKLSSFSDNELLTYMFKYGITRHTDQERGQGLVVSAQKAMRLGANIDIRLKSAHIHIGLTEKIVQTENRWSYNEPDSLPLIPLNGTHFTLEFEILSL